MASAAHEGRPEPTPIIGGTIVGTVTDLSHDAERPSLHDLFDDRGQQWLGEIIDAVNDGAYAEAVETVLEDEARLDGSDTEA